MSTHSKLVRTIAAVINYYVCAKIACKMSFDPDRNYLRKWIEIDPDRIWFGTMSVQCGRNGSGFIRI